MLPGCFSFCTVSLSVSPFLSVVAVFAPSLSPDLTFPLPLSPSPPPSLSAPQCPYFKEMRVTVETLNLPDRGETENVSPPEPRAAIAKPRDVAGCICPRCHVFPFPSRSHTPSSTVVFHPLTPFPSLPSPLLLFPAGLQPVPREARRAQGGGRGHRVTGEGLLDSHHLEEGERPLQDPIREAQQGAAAARLAGEGGRERESRGRERG